MPNRRRITTPPMGRRSFLYGLAATAVAAPLATWGARNATLLVDTPGSAPINATLNTAPLSDAVSVLVDDAAVVTQTLADALNPLRGIVKEISHPETFSQFALTWPADQQLDLFVRSERADGTWSPWFHADSHGPMDSGTTNGTELLYVEPTNKVQIVSNGLNIFGPGSGVNLSDIVGIDKIDFAGLNLQQFGLPAIKNLADIPMSLDWSNFAPMGDAMALDSVTAVFIDGNAGQEGTVIEPAAYSTEFAGAPKIVSRAQWGADESMAGSPETYSTFKGTCVHHTAGSNNYTAAQSAGIVRGIYAYHTKSLGWKDVGYNALVDKFGTVFEGRYGGLDRNIIGAHVGGFNEGTFGISVMGNYDTVDMPDAAVNAVGEMIGWRMSLGGVDPTSTAAFASTGYSGARYSKGATVQFPAIFGHRDAGYTSCPGTYGYAKLDRIRQLAKAKFDGVGAPAPAPATEPAPGTAPNPAEAVPGVPAQTDLLQPAPAADSTSAPTPTSLPIDLPAQAQEVLAPLVGPTAPAAPAV